MLLPIVLREESRNNKSFSGSNVHWHDNSIIIVELDYNLVALVSFGQTSLVGAFGC